ncbi:MAG: DegT/DnrJ/EryC1/StrS family aminotransferase [Gammaproteobacteria bacterium]|nr:DegT/DnrJ/EryC1/StrS family aminotransferase [Gammaproteobacteria bacterium]
MIPMLDLKLQYSTLKNEIDTAVADVLQNTHFIMGPNVVQFESEAAQYLGVKHAISCNSGTDALHLALRACGIGENDEVITTPFSFAATAEAICYVGATPVFVDIDPETYNISTQAIKAAITSKTKAILPVHIFGQAADMQEIAKLAKDNNLRIIEDCAQSFGARINNQQTGTLGDAGCFSFFPSKNLGCYGDGGLFTTNSDEIAEQFTLLKSHGSKVRNQHEIIGWNSRLDELQAAILRIKLKHIDDFNKNRIAVAKKYNKLLSSPSINTPSFKENMSHVFHQYTLLSENRDAISEQLNKEKIGHAVYYPMPLSEQPAFNPISRAESLNTTQDICSKCISLPIFPEMTDEQIEKVVDTVKRV